MLCLVFAEIDGRVVGLVGVEDGVDLAGEARHQLLVGELHHAVEGELTGAALRPTYVHVVEPPYDV